LCPIPVKIYSVDSIELADKLKVFSFFCKSDQTGTMKLSLPVVLAFLAFLANCGFGAAECTAVESIPIKLGEGATKMSFAGFVPSVKR
jgi:hypothetical protein